jgi:hypothetical protein
MYLLVLAALVLTAEVGGKHAPELPILGGQWAMPRSWTNPKTRHIDKVR